MVSNHQVFQEQIKSACKITEASWAAWFVHGEERWEVRFIHGLAKSRIPALMDFIHQPKTLAWFGGALSSGRMRSRSTNTFARELRARRIFLFPNQDTQSVTLVGAEGLGATEKGLFRILVSGLAADHWETVEPEERTLPLTIEAGSEVTYDLVDTLIQILQKIVPNFPCDMAYIAIRRGEIFDIEACWKCPDKTAGLQISAEENSILKRMTVSKKAQLVDQSRMLVGLVPVEKSEQHVKSWLGAPIVIGNRSVGLLALASQKRSAFTPDHTHQLEVIAVDVAPTVENAIAFAEARRHLQRLALLNELALTTSAGLDIDMLMNRVLRLLHRTFPQRQVSIYLLSSDGSTLQDYGETAEKTTPARVPVKNTLAGHVIQTGLPYHSGGEKKTYKDDVSDPVGKAVLGVPLKYRGKAIGVLSLETPAPGTYSKEDEQLLLVISSHLAGLIENVRLSEEIRERARNLDLIHQVIQRVLGLTDEGQIAMLSAELMAERFSYELALVMVFSKDRKYLVSRGAGGSKSSLVELGKRIQFDHRRLEIMLESGNSIRSNGPRDGLDLFTIPDWQAGSQMCVPLREGEWVFGLLVVERSEAHSFSENDLQVLESLAGFLSSVLMNARRYQQLQTNVLQLQAARETAIDIGTDLDLDTLLRRIVYRVRKLVDVKGAELGLVRDDEEVVEILVSLNPWNEYRGLKIPLTTDVAGRVAASGKPLVVNDYNNWHGKSLFEKAPFNSVASVPLQDKGQVIGTLTVYDDQLDRVFRSKDVQILELLAPQISVSIRNARLYHELQERIQAQKLAERRLVQSARLAAVGEMAAGVAHELNNPLTTVAGFAELITEEIPADFTQRPDLELILREAKRAREVVRRLLDFSRQSESAREYTNVNDVVGDVLTLVRHLARTSGVETYFNRAETLPFVYVDRNQLKQVLLNLVHNALHAMPTGGDLRVTTQNHWKDDRTWVTIEVRDTGVGIPGEHLDKIFEPFFTTKPTGTGTGLGLSISYGIISDHGGYIEVESQPGEGSSFMIWLPEVSENGGS